MMHHEPEIRRLLDVMPASGRMLTKLISKPEQRMVIDYPFPLPWMRDRPISINFDLWSRLSRPQRDLVILRAVSWLMAVKWFQPNAYLGMASAGLLGAGIELFQQDLVGVAMSGALTALAMTQIWRNQRNSRSEIDADDQAIRVAQRRGYSETEAARHLLSAIELIAQLEGRAIDFQELLRCQNLRAIAGISPLGVPEAVRRE